MSAGTSRVSQRTIIRTVRSGVRSRCVAACGAVVGLLVAGGCGAPAITPPVSQNRVSVVRTGSSETRLTGIGPIRGYGRLRDHSLIHCLELTLEAIGRPLSYDDLMGISGVAFRTQFRRGEWSAAAADAHVGNDCVDSLMNDIGVQCSIWHDTGGRSLPDSVRREIVAAIDAGMPVTASNVVPPDWGLIVGYRNSGREWFCRAYRNDARVSELLTSHAPLATLIPSPPLPIADMRPVYLNSLRRAVAMIDAEPDNGFVQGRAAFDEWIARLQDVREASYMQPNAWLYVSLIDARIAAAGYLRRIAMLFPAHQKLLNDAADLYAREAALLDARREFVPFPGDYAAGMPTDSMRRQQITALRQALELEERAVGLLRQVVGG